MSPALNCCYSREYEGSRVLWSWTVPKVSPRDSGDSGGFVMRDDTRRTKARLRGHGRQYGGALSKWTSLHDDLGPRNFSQVPAPRLVAVPVLPGGKTLDHCGPRQSRHPQRRGTRGGQRDARYSPPIKALPTCFATKQVGSTSPSHWPRFAPRHRVIQEFIDFDTVVTMRSTEGIAMSSRASAAGSGM